MILLFLSLWCFIFHK